MKTTSISTTLFLAIFLITFSFSQKTRADDEEELAKEETTKKADDDEFKERPLDGVTIEALETYRNPKNSQLTFDLSMLPFNAYYTGFGINAAYIYILNKTYATELT